MLEMVLDPLALSAQTFNAGDKVRVTVAFKYSVLVDATVYLYAGPYYSNLFGKNLVGTCVGQANIALPANSSPTDKTAAVDFTLLPKAQGGIEDGTYGLAVWVRSKESSTDPWALPGPMGKLEQENALIVSGNPSGGGLLDSISSMMPMIMMVMMIGMMAPMMQGMGGGED